MTPIKAYTDLSQSKTLSKILPIESADFMWEYDPDKETYWDKPTMIPIDSYIFVNDIPCWSLAALLGVLPTNLQIVLAINDFQGDRKEKYAIGSVEHDKYDCFADNPVDACVAMIEKLHERKML